MVDGARSGELTRRGFLALSGALGVSAAGYAASRLIDRAHSYDPAGVGGLNDIDHIVLLMQENRSFDHYFGTMSGVRGFNDPTGRFAQRGWRLGVGPDPRGTVSPFHLNTRSPLLRDADILDDPSHTWTAQHESWNHGRMDGWLRAHLPYDGASTPLIMGYYTRADIPVHYGLADAFTVCDHYFSSVMGPTRPNRLTWMSGSIAPAGHANPAVYDLSRSLQPHTLRWRTFPENLQEAGVSWKVYNHPGPSTRSDLSGMLNRFHQYRDPSSQLYRRGIAPRYPSDFLADVAGGNLPSVSWIIPPSWSSEHPALPPAVGGEGILRVLEALTANPAIWERTVLVVSYDENGGLFDHVPPPVPPRSEADEFVDGPRGPEPIGLGFRVPCLVLSPYTRGGLVCSDVSDHTSQLRLVGRRFGVEVPNLSSWRRRTVGDLTETFPSPWRGDTRTPSFPQALAAANEALKDDRSLIRAGNTGHRPALPIAAAPIPRQQRLPRRRRLPS